MSSLFLVASCAFVLLAALILIAKIITGYDWISLGGSYQRGAFSIGSAMLSVGGVRDGRGNILRLPFRRRVGSLWIGYLFMGAMIVAITNAAIWLGIHLVKEVGAGGAVFAAFIGLVACLFTFLFTMMFVD